MENIVCASQYNILTYIIYLPAIVAGIFFSFFVLSGHWRQGTNRALASISLIFSVWIFFNFFTWFPQSIDQYEWFQRFSMLFVLIFPSIIYFAYYLTEYKIKSYVHLIIHLPIFPVIILPFTRFQPWLFTVDVAEAGFCQLDEGPLYPYMQFLNLFYLIWTTAVLLRRYRLEGTGKIMKKLIHFTMLAIIFFIFWVIIFQTTCNLVDRSLLMFVPLGIMFFVSILFYTIGRYHLFKISLFAIKFLVIIVWFLLSIQISLYRFGERGFFHMLAGLVISIIFGIFLVRVLGKEEERRVELETISEKLIQVNEELKELDLEKTSFIDIASHRLRTPLTSVKGFVSLMLEGNYGPISDEQRKVLNKVFITSDRLAWTIEDILNASQMETGRMKFKYDYCQLEDLTQQIIDIFSAKAKEKNLYLKFQKPAVPHPKLLIDGMKIQEVISNLIDNAIKYTQEGGISVALENLGGMIRLTVADTGMGLENKELRQLFSRYTRGRDLTRMTTEGVGLGLYVSRLIIESNGGRIWVKSEGRGRGSQFSFELPIEQRPHIIKAYQKKQQPELPV